MAALNELATTAFLRTGQRLLVPSTGEVQPQNFQPMCRKRIIVDISEQRCGRLRGRHFARHLALFDRDEQCHQNRAFQGAEQTHQGLWRHLGYLDALLVGHLLVRRHRERFSRHSLESNGRRIWAGLVGSPATFGCVMLRDVPMKELWNWAEIGTEVVIRR